MRLKISIPLLLMLISTSLLPVTAAPTLMPDLVRGAAKNNSDEKICMRVTEESDIVTDGARSCKDECIANLKSLELESNDNQGIGSESEDFKQQRQVAA